MSKRPILRLSAVRSQSRSNRSQWIKPNVTRWIQSAIAINWGETTVSNSIAVTSVVVAIGCSKAIISRQRQ
jgi:hypothetical protein